MSVTQDISTLSPDGAASPASPSVPCPLADLPTDIHQYIHRIEERIAYLEAERNRFAAALLGMGKFIFENPASKMMLAALPKEAQNKLREYFGK